MKIDKNQVILFQGDSITDCGRDRSAQDQMNHNGALGNGYAGRLAGELLAQYPGNGLRIFNRGISGNRIVDLYARVKADAVNLQPDLLSILIGVNDTWHEFQYGNGVESDRFEQVYRMFLEYTRASVPKVCLVLCEPFVLGCGVVTPDWERDIRVRQEIVLRLAKEFKTVHVPFQEMFNEALKDASPEYWANDGVHPTPAGHALMTRFWRARVGI